ncbi:MAG: DUF5683 domain-containing protein [Candidatus Dadabacteria bacterium]|nr:DUF5683 domain-containing protein [Candidatus Dadabacteria bacterium]
MRSSMRRLWNRIPAAARRRPRAISPAGRIFLAAFGSVVASAFIPAVSFGQDSLCVHFAGERGGLHIDLGGEYSMNGVIPLTMCDLRPGESWNLTVNGKGLETRRGYFQLDAAGVPGIRGNRLSTVLRNSMIPGWGSIKAGRRTSGLTDLGLAALFGWYFMIEEFEYRDMKEEYDELGERLENAVSLDERERLTDAMHSASKALNAQNTHRKRALYATAAVYGYQLLDPILCGSPPGWDSDAGGSIIRLDLPERSKAKALFYSAVWPGRGQLYQGKITRGILFPLLSAAAGVYALDRMNSVDEYSVLYEVEIEKWQSAVSLEDRTYHGDRASSIWEDLEETRQERNTAFILFAGIWGLNVLDTFFEHEEYVPSPGFTMDFTPAGMTFVMKF